jgi:hypothetical protein
MTDKLSLYNGALRKLGERKLASLSEDRAPRRYLDDAWDDGAVTYCLEQGNWTFATRSQKLEPSTSLIPDFGYKYAYEKSTDWLSTVAICSDEYYKNGLQYSEEAGIIYCDWNEIYVKFVESFFHNLPKILFIIMPFFAFLLWLFHSKKRWSYFDI